MPSGSLRRSQRETWASSGTSRPSACSSTTRASCSTLPTLPSRRSKIAREWWWWSAARPTARSTAVTEVKDIAWFLGENASIEGAMTVTLEASSPSQV